jgi:hypothetical protein
MDMWRQHRRDPTSVHALPFAAELMSYGADGKALAPVDLIDKATDEFLNAQGVPAEMYRGTMQLQTAPVAVRLFERTWVSWCSGMNNFLGWLLRRVADLRNWEKVDIRIQPPKLVDSLEDQQVRLQLYASGKTSGQSALSPFGLDPKREFKQILEEQRMQDDEMQKYQEDMAQRQQLQQTMQYGAQGMLPFAPGVAPQQPGGAPPGGAPRRLWPAKARRHNR